MKITRQKFGTEQGQAIWQYWLENEHGYRLAVMTYGATLTNLELPDKNGQFKNVVIGYDNLADYLKQDAYFGATVGRVAGRIAKGQFELDGQRYQTPINNGENTNHGGPNSFESQIWKAQSRIDTTGGHVSFKYTSPAGQNGFPGQLTVSVTYTLTEDNEWWVDYQAESDQTTLFNPTCHVYFNLTGDFDQTVEQHELQINSQVYGAIQPDGLPTGELVDVTGTAFDFRTPQPLERGFVSTDAQNKLVNGYDHPFLLDETNEQPAAILTEPKSGRKVTIFTQGNSLVVYTANGFGSEPNLTEKAIQPHEAVALEAQMMPDAIHQPTFGNVVLLAGDQYHRRTIYRLN